MEIIKSVPPGFILHTVVRKRQCVKALHGYLKETWKDALM